MSFAKNLKKAMDERNMSQVELSALTGIGKSSISQYLSGKNEPKQKAVEKIADALECSVAYLNGITTCSDPTDDPNGLKNVSVSEAAKRIGKSEQFIRVGLQRNILPFGVAVKLSSRFSYHISPKLLNEYIGA
ncbi:helix-turn-helix domain-containing protein [Vallitalea guaymasensis]|uniref:helix-turn-helix domain-containing protein n=1 Tax=Vallitalea guaymasensis TaxID=1185412 RepID=UPI001FA8D7F6|nr:helix-turn-helix transcriptional regulator [Vallitalea guaymasensis]